MWQMNQAPAPVPAKLSMHSLRDMRLRSQRLGCIVVCACAVMALVVAAAICFFASPVSSGPLSPTRALMTEFRNGDAEIVTVVTFNNRMVFDGLPFLLNVTDVPGTNMTGNMTWANITSQHVKAYWESLGYNDFNITNVATNLFNQFSEPNNDDPNILRTRVIYDQQIQYTSTGMDSPVSDTDDEMTLFTKPFQSNPQSYVGELSAAFEPSNKILLLDMSLASDVTPSPSSMPTIAPTSKAYSKMGVPWALVITLTLSM